MSMKTVRLDADSEEILQRLACELGLSISAVLKEGLLALRDRQAAHAKVPSPYEIFSQLDLGPGGYALAPSTDSRRGVAEVLRRKPRR